MTDLKTTYLEIEIANKLVCSFRTNTIPAVGETISLKWVGKQTLIRVKKRDWIVDHPDISRLEEFRCVLMCDLVKV